MSYSTVLGVVCTLVVFGLAGCEPNIAGTTPQTWSEAEIAKAAARERRKEFYRGGRAGAR